jgi:hypothetical protein
MLHGDAFSLLQSNAVSNSVTSLHALWNFTAPAILNEQMNVIGTGDIVEDAWIEALSCLKQPTYPCAPVFGEPQKKFLRVTAVGNVPNMAGYVNDWLSAGSFFLGRSISFHP